MGLRRFFRDSELEAPNVGSWARRVAVGLEKTEGQGSWDRRLVEDINEEENLGPGSWRTRTNRAIELELLGASSGSAGGVELVGYTHTLTATQTVPLEAEPGDLLLAFFGGRSSGFGSSPNFVTLATSGTGNSTSGRAAVFSRTLLAEDPATFGFSGVGSFGGGYCLALRGGTVLGATSASVANTATVPALPSQPFARILGFAGRYAADGFAWGGGLVSVANSIEGGSNQGHGFATTEVGDVEGDFPAFTVAGDNTAAVGVSVG